MRNPYKLLQSTHNATCKNILIFVRNFGTCANNRVSTHPKRRTRPTTTEQKNANASQN